MKYFYARVSTERQNLERQLEAAKSVSPDKIFTDKMSGKTCEREQYQMMKRMLKEGDEVIVKELDRLGRNYDLIREEIKWFKDHGITWRSMDIPTTMMDFGGQKWVQDMITDLLITVLGNIAEQERLKMLDRQRGGIDAMPIVNGKRVSLKTGRPTGRPEIQNPNFQKFFAAQKSGLMSIEDCCKKLGISRATWYNKIKEVSA